MPELIEEPTLSESTIISAAKNEWGKTFTLGHKDDDPDLNTELEFEIKDLTYFDYIDFVALAKPIVSLVANGMDYTSTNGELGLEFNPQGLDYDAIFKACEKDLPKMAWLVCKQSHPKLKQNDVAMLAHRPQRLIEIILLQVLHNNMIQEFASFFQRLTAMVTTVVPDMAKVAQPSEVATE